MELEKYGLSWFKDQISKPEHILMHRQTEEIRKNFLREHKVDERAYHTYAIGNMRIAPTVANLNFLPVVSNFHSSFLMGDPVTLTGSEKAVSLFTKHYRKGGYAGIDYKIVDNLNRYGNAYEYVYLSGDKITSKVFRNENSYPIYDIFENLIGFVEYSEDKTTHDSVTTIYYPGHVDTYVNNRLYESAINTSGLPIHYKSQEPWKYPIYGDSYMASLIKIHDNTEKLLSRLDDAVNKNSLNPILKFIGKSISKEDMMPSEMSGQASYICLDYDSDADFINANMDYNSIKLLLSKYEQYFTTIAALPANLILGQNVANLSEGSLSMLFMLTKNRAKMTKQSLDEGFHKRWDYMRAIMATLGEDLSQEDYETLSVTYNESTPVDYKNTLECLQIQKEMGAISTRSAIELSPLISDADQEMSRLAEEKPLENIE